jgi:pSer/pThr/pTyr-binding forkhead associated (FHA) protein
MAQLLVPNGLSFAIEGKKTLVGRSPQSQIVLSMPEISRRHCEITEDDQGFWVEDIGSRNGTFVNGRRIEKRTKINDGDRIGIAGLEVLFSDSKDTGPRTFSFDTTPQNSREAD